MGKGIYVDFTYVDTSISFETDSLAGKVDTFRVRIAKGFEETLQEKLEKGGFLEFFREGVFENLVRGSDGEIEKGFVGLPQGKSPKGKYTDYKEVMKTVAKFLQRARNSISPDFEEARKYIKNNKYMLDLIKKYGQ